MKNKVHIRVKDIANAILIIVVITIGINVVSKYNYHEFYKSVRERGKTSFSRDTEIKYSEIKSYKLENKDYNDAMFYKTIEVTPNTPYKVTCMVKTENIENQKNLITGGAQISIRETIECSKALTGSNDWTELTFMFNSKNRTSLDIGFRLGGFEEMSKGTAWFSNLKIEEGYLDSTNKWNMACFIIENLDVNIELDGKRTNIKVQMSSEDINDIETNVKRLPNTMKSLSNNQMTIDYDIIRIKEPLKKISYDKKNEYYVAPKDVINLIDEYLQKEEYDYIFVAVRLGNINNKNEVLVHDWIGLRWHGILWNRFF